MSRLSRFADMKKPTHLLRKPELPYMGRVLYFDSKSNLRHKQKEAEAKEAQKRRNTFLQNEDVRPD